MGACAIAACVLFPCCRFRRHSHCCRCLLQGVTIVCTMSASCSCNCVPLYCLLALQRAPLPQCHAADSVY
jgi:hypothetical protein